MNIRFVFCALLLSTLPSYAAGVSPILSAMTSELDRSHARLRLKGYEAPYFIAYSVREYHSYDLVSRFGSAVSEQQGRRRQAYVEVRVGDYGFDNTSSELDSSVSLDDQGGYDAPVDGPLDEQIDAMRGTLWLLTDAKYKHALNAYAQKKGRRARVQVEDENLASFSRAKASESTDPIVPLKIDQERWRARLNRITAKMMQVRELFDATAEFSGEQTIHYLVNTEKSRIVTSRTLYTIHISAFSRAKDGMLLEHEKNFYGNDPDALVSDENLDRGVEQLIGELRELQKAPSIDPYTGPALLMEEAAGVFFHETVGHRLEGERQGDEKEGRTFKGQLNRVVLPTFLSVVDDPTQKQIQNIPLNGYYTYDDEGVAAQPAVLVKNGVLRDYLKSRAPIAGSLKSNGHGRAEGVADPMGRMANLIVQSSKKFSVAELKKMLIAEVQRQGKPYGLIIRDIAGGSTNTANFGYQAFKGQPRLVYRVDANTGDETLVRGVEMVGTPLTTISKIIATSDTVGIFNGFCGAESGLVPVSTVSPAILMAEIELQRAQQSSERPPLLPAPWLDTPTKPAAPAKPTKRK